MNKLMLALVGFGLFFSGCQQPCAALARALAEAASEGRTLSSQEVEKAQDECDPPPAVYTEGDETAGILPIVDTKSTLFEASADSPPPEGEGVVIETEDLYPSGVPTAYCVIITDGLSVDTLVVFFKENLYGVNFWTQPAYSWQAPFITETFTADASVGGGWQAAWVNNPDTALLWVVEAVTLTNAGLVATAATRLNSISSYPFFAVEVYPPLGIDSQGAIPYVDEWSTDLEGGAPTIYVAPRYEDCATLVTK